MLQCQSSRMQRKDIDEASPAGTVVRMKAHNLDFACFHLHRHVNATCEAHQQGEGEG